MAALLHLTQGVNWFSPPLLALGALVALVVALVALLWAVVSHRRLKRLQQHFSGWFRHVGDADLKGAIDRALAQEEVLREMQRRLQDREQRALHAISRYGLVRFNAFPDSAADLSFSVAFLSDAGDGLVLTSLWGRDEVRVYAKEVHSQESRVALTPEERQAIALAMNRRIP